MVVAGWTAVPLVDLAMLKLLGSCLLIFASGVFAQTPDTATIQGQVTDPSRAAVPGVQIAARNQQSGLERTALTDAAGNYSLAGLPVAGKYQITATRQGFADAQVKDVTLAGGATAGINLQLSVSGGQTQITVTGTVGEVPVALSVIHSVTDDKEVGNREAHIIGLDLLQPPRWLVQQRGDAQ